MNEQTKYYVNKTIKYCPNCGIKTKDNIFIEKWGIASQTSGWGSCRFLECVNCKFQFNLRKPITGDYKPKFIEDSMPIKNPRPSGESRRNRIIRRNQ